MSTPPKINKDYKGGLKVIGAGLGRTGTSSLKMAFEILYAAPCYHMTEIIGATNQGTVPTDHVNFFMDVIRFKNTTNPSDSAKAAIHEEIEKQYDNYASTTDLPACMYWKELLTAYPNAKVVLSVRDAKGWHKSCTDTIFNFELCNPNMPLGVKILTTFVPFYRRWSRMVHACWGYKFNADYSLEQSTKVFDEFNASVIKDCPKDKLLVFDVKEGWDPLCKFLNLPVPEQKFPHENDTAHFKKVVFIMNIMGYALAASTAAVAYVGGKFIMKYIE